ncbi:hypothetical protein RFI_36150, partial [Reticulomyxa filosa]
KKKTKTQHSFNKDATAVNCVKFSSYFYQKHHHNFICFSSADKIIRFWDIEHNQQFQVFNEHANAVRVIEFSSFNGTNNEQYIIFKIILKQQKKKR